MPVSYQRRWSGSSDLRPGQPAESSPLRSAEVEHAETGRFDLGVRRAGAVGAGLHGHLDRGRRQRIDLWLSADALFDPDRRRRAGREFAAADLLAVEAHPEEHLAVARTGAVVGELRRAGAEDDLDLAWRLRPAAVGQWVGDGIAAAHRSRATLRAGRQENRELHAGG